MKHRQNDTNQVGEWGKTARGQWVVVGRNPSKGSGLAAPPKADPADYFADTGFRVVQDAPDETMKAPVGAEARDQGTSGQDAQPDDTNGPTREIDNRHHYH